MAELLLCVTDDVRPSDVYQDGDPICAFTTRRIHATHAESYCHRRAHGFTSDGLRPPGLAQTWYELTHAYKFVRVGDSVERHDLRTVGPVEVFGRTPNAKGEAIDVEAYLQRRLAHAAHAIFGTPGAEVWYGGAIDQSAATVAAIWDAIEAATPHRRAQHGRWPLSPLEKRHFLALPMDEFDDDEAATWLTSETDDTGALLRKRSVVVPWRDHVPPGQVVRVLDRAQEVDLRDTLPPRARAAVTQKPARAQR